MGGESQSGHYLKHVLDRQGTLDPERVVLVRVAKEVTQVVVEQRTGVAHEERLRGSLVEVVLWAFLDSCHRTHVDGEFGSKRILPVDAPIDTRMGVEVWYADAVEGLRATARWNGDGGARRGETCGVCT